MAETSRPEPTASDLPEDRKKGRDDRPLPPAARRALAEAEERRRRMKARRMPKELGGRDGPEPTRYGDWEKNGIISDF